MGVQRAGYETGSSHIRANLPYKRIERRATSALDVCRRHTKYLMGLILLEVGDYVSSLAMEEMESGSRCFRRFAVDQLRFIRILITIACVI